MYRPEAPTFRNACMCSSNANCLTWFKIPVRVTCCRTSNSQDSMSNFKYSNTAYRKIINTSMMTSSNGNIFRVTGPLCGEFTGPGEFPAQRPVTRGFDVFFDLRLNKRLSKQPWGWWFETPAWSLWRHRNEQTEIHLKIYGFGIVDTQLKGISSSKTRFDAHIC